MKLQCLRTIGLLTIGLLCCGMSYTFGQEAPGAKLETDWVRIQVDAKGTVTSVFDKTNKTEYARQHFDARFCALTVKRGQKQSSPTAVTQSGDTIRVTFDCGAVATLKTETFPQYFTVEVVAVETPENGGFYKLEFGRCFLNIDYAKKPPFAMSALILSIQTDIFEMPGLCARIGGICFSEIGYKGAKIAVLGTPFDQLRPTMKIALEKLLACAESDPAVMESLPVVSKAGGPWAIDQSKSHGSYIITSRSPVESEVDDWTEYLKQFGVDQVDFHQGAPFRQADFTFNEKSYPKGAGDFRRMTDAFAQKGVICGLHTYATCVPMQGSKFVAPVPHDDLCIMETYTLAGDIDENTTELAVVESTDAVSNVVGYLVWNSLYLRIDDELVMYKEVVKDGKRGFAQCSRGVLGTTKAKHGKGAPVRHLGSLFSSYFTPEPGSPLYYQIARDTAKAYDDGGFQMIYLDALDGNCRAIRNSDLVWYYDALFVREILRNIKTVPPLLEYSTMHASLWAARSRMGAWDSPNRGYQAFLDMHFASNYESATKRFLPGQMGWISLCPSARGYAPFNFTTRFFYPEEIEYMATKVLAWDHGMSYNDVSVGSTNPGLLAAGAVMKKYETLRRSNRIGESVKERLRKPGEYFTLRDTNGTPYFLRAAYPAIQVDGNKAEGAIVNGFKEQQPSVRIENLHATGAWDGADAQTLAPFDGTKPALQNDAVTFDPPLDLKGKRGMGLWIYGDGKGQTVNIRIHSPAFRFGGVADHYAKIDFSGWKYFSWAEAQNGMYPDVQWASRGGLYLEYRNPVHYEAISRIDIMVNGAPGGLKFRALKALPLVERKTVNPKITVSGRTIAFTGTIPCGAFMRYEPGGKALVFNVKGETVSTMSVEGTMPQFAPGRNKVVFEESGTDKTPARSLLTWQFLGEKVE